MGQFEDHSPPPPLIIQLRCSEPEHGSPSGERLDVGVAGLRQVGHDGFCQSAFATGVDNIVGFTAGAEADHVHEGSFKAISSDGFEKLPQTFFAPRPPAPTFTQAPAGAGDRASYRYLDDALLLIRNGRIAAAGGPPN